MGSDSVACGFLLEAELEIERVVGIAGQRVEVSDAQLN